MKTLTTLTSVFLLGAALAQDYVPFHSPSKFQEVGGSNEEFFFPEETIVNGGVIEVKQYQKKSDSIFDLDINNPCPSWGGMAEWSFAGWLGRNLNYNQTAKTLAIDSIISFDFNLSLGDSSLFYMDGMHEYYIRYTSKTEEQVLNFTDSVRNYAIETYNLQGSLVANQYSTQAIRIAKSLGAINFIDLSDFPTTQKEYQIIGQANTNLGHLGNYGLTYDEAFPWDVGDTIQCYGTNVLANGGENSYVTYFITNRTETSDSVFISLSKKIYHTASIGGQSTSDTTDLSYNITYDDVYAYERNKLIGNQAHQYAGFGEFYNHTSETYEKYDNSKTGYCDSCNCFTQYDAYLQNFNHFVYQKNFGLTMQEVEVFGEGLKAQAYLVYARVGNNVYGNYHAANVNEAALIEVKLAPNPVTDFIHLSSNERIASVNIYNTTGALLQSKAINSQQSKLDVQRFNQGVYLIQITFDNGQQTTQRFVKQN
ncbi:Por secretion system C-terminal sorting domain-containing protein [Lishizhenia tianjinensis]|uniref:Por secretion system C-terminal sorting domain-containing protein n=1 Tax=Lishizhenia tianjinensis TaxID=477690 RepID=A0A1I7B9U7_9FLAO|nr:T9SS type A sorting domain-containing protein [Lishizhenia tianjinensis]SFT83965.1 Por secretion system C-terminal sorting domain-containing protein [Lishizhenia tianjinensis]